MKKIPHLVLLPGLLCDASLFRQQADALADAAHVIVADLTLSDSISALAEHILKHLPKGKFVLAGMSMGGYVAFEIMRQAPERVIALALLGTSANPETPDASAAREELIAQAENDFSAVVDTLLERMAHPDNADEREVGGVFKSMAMGLGREVFELQERAIIGRADSRPTLATIRCPTLVVGGREDLVIPLAAHRELAAAIDGARLEIIEDCGHLLPLEQSKKLTEILRQWLASLETS